MAALGKLVVSVSANIAQFSAAMDKAAYLARSRMNMVASAIKNVRTIIATSFAALAAGTAIAFKNMIQNADDLVKSSQKIGVTVEELQKIRYAAELANLSTEEVTKAMVKLARAAVDGNAAFAAIGVLTKDASGNIKPMAQLLAEVSDKFASYKDGAEKTALAVEIFGKSGAEIIPLLNGGSVALAQAAKEADKFGFVMDANTAKSAERLNDNMTRLGRVWDGLLTQLLSGLIPSIEKFSNAMIAMASNSNVAQSAVIVFGAALKILGTVAVPLIGVIETLITMISGIGGAFKSIATGDFSGAIDSINKATSDLSLVAQKTWNGFKAIWGSANSAGEDIAKQLNAGGGVNAPIVAVEKGNQKLKQLAEQRASLLRNQFEEIIRLVSGEEELARVQAERLRMNDSEMAQFEKNLVIIKELRVAQEERQQAEAAASQAFADMARVIEDNMSPLEQYQAQLERLNDLLAAGLPVDQYIQSVQKLQDAFDKSIQDQKDSLYSGLLTEEEQIRQSYDRRRQAILESTIVTESEKADLLRRAASVYDEEIKKVADQMSKTKDVQVEFGRAIESAFERAIVNGEGLRSVLKGIEQDIIAIVTRQLITKPFGDFISGMLSNFGGSFFGGTQSPAPVTDYSQPSGRAIGGPMLAGVPYMVGEQGPELFVPTSSGNVYSNAQTRSSAATGMNVVINITTPDASSFRSSMGQTTESVTRMLTRARRNM